MAHYKAAIVGLSWIGADPVAPATHPALGTAPPYSHAAAYAATPGVDVVAGCDIDPAACAAFRDGWRERWSELRTYADYRQLLAAERPDLLSVVTPDDRHTEIVLAAVAAGVPAIFCEKPLATSLAEADAMVAAARAAGAVISVNHTRRWLPPYVAARQELRAGAIGPLAQIVAHYGGPRAMLYRNHSHFLDLLCYFAESAPAWVAAELEPGFEDYGTAYRGDGGRDPATEPGANAYVVFRNGVRAFLSGMKHAAPAISVDLFGASGQIHVDDAAAVRLLPGESAPTTQLLVPRATRAGMAAAVADLIAALETGTPTQSPPKDARQAVALIEAILESQARGNVRVAVR